MKYTQLPSLEANESYVKIKRRIPWMHDDWRLHLPCLYVLVDNMCEVRSHAELNPLDRVPKESGVFRILPNHLS